MLKCSLVLRSSRTARSRWPSDSMVALALLSRSARPLARSFASSAPPMARSPALKISACSRFSRVWTPMSRRSRAARVAARSPSLRLDSRRLVMARRSP
ncbi:hypothetical protein BVH06_12550 [Pseudomonas sp. PA27(2017)]|nr:hypothetical protein BVH06_12550 [Pseudomonas sp. PA27(2017)]